MGKYQRPVLLLNEVTTKEGISWEGSARGYDKSDLADFRKFCLESNYVMYAEGHANAFGFGIKYEDIDAFINYVNEQQQKNTTKWAMSLLQKKTKTEN